MQEEQQERQTDLDVQHLPPWWFLSANSRLPWKSLMGRYSAALLPPPQMQKRFVTHVFKVYTFLTGCCGCGVGDQFLHPQRVLERDT